MNNLFKTCLTTLSLLLPVWARADIVTDGSLGPMQTLSGPDFVIKANIGQQHGGNLFHSFSQFNIAAGESATFTGPTDIANIISRVTGDNISTINGLLRSEIDGANVFLLNPMGIMFGPNANIDISGSLHIGSADYLMFEDLQKFLSTPQKGELLSTAAPTEFGFLGQPSIEGAGAIEIQGSQLVAKALSLTARTLTISDGAILNGELVSTQTGNSVNSDTTQSSGITIISDDYFIEGDDDIESLAITGNTTPVAIHTPTIITLNTDIGIFPTTLDVNGTGNLTIDDLSPLLIAPYEKGLLSTPDVSTFGFLQD